MLSIGIDVSKGKSTVCGMKPGGEIVYAPFEVQHTREEMLELVSCYIFERGYLPTKHLQNRYQRPLRER